MARNEQALLLLTMTILIFLVTCFFIQGHLAGTFGGRLL